MSCPAKLAATAAVAAMLSLSACDGPSPYQKLQNTLHVKNALIAELKEENRQLRDEVITQRRQVETLQGLGEGRLQKIPHSVKIALFRHTGGIDIDGTPGHDGIKVYVQPIDQHGSVIKAAGDVKIQLYDLAEPPERNLLGEHAWSVDKIHETWSGGFMSQHYSLLCPFEGGEPAHDEITVRVEFTDYLTGRTHSAQKACKIDLPRKTPTE